MPFGSLALALNVIVAGAVKTDPLDGAVIVTVGFWLGGGGPLVPLKWFSTS